MTNLDYLAQTLLHICLRPGFDVDIQDYDEDTGVYIFWSKPRVNTTWYPIIQIDYCGKTIYHREGPEYNREEYNWGSFLRKAADFLYDYQYEQQIKSISKGVTTE